MSVVMDGHVERRYRLDNMCQLNTQGPLTNFYSVLGYHPPVCKLGCSLYKGSSLSDMEGPTRSQMWEWKISVQTDAANTVARSPTRVSPCTLALASGRGQARLTPSPTGEEPASCDVPSVSLAPGGLLGFSSCRWFSGAWPW
jgi:hypothetical protein